jgi:murein L,D-transpeptidase YafK
MRRISGVEVAALLSVGLSVGLWSALSLGQTETSQPIVSRVPASLVQVTPQTVYYSPYAFVVDKKSRTLTVWHQEEKGPKAVAVYPADMGRSEGDKKSQGDYKTPNGIYFLQQRLEGNSLDFKLYGQLAFTTNYPNFFDRLEGKTGSGIWLHAVPESVALTRGSKGCVVVSNKVIPELAKYVKLQKTPLIIQDEVDLLDSDKSHQLSQNLSKAIESWRQAWEKKDIKGYMEFYGDDFHSLGMDRQAWQKHKEHLNELYKQFSVKISRPVIYAYKNQAVVRFLQSYTSDMHTDFGEKVLYLTNVSPDGPEFKIVGEDWHPESGAVAQEEFNAQEGTQTVSN